MQLKDYVHVELDSHNKYFDVKPTRQLTGKHQVAIVDVTYVHEGERRLGEHDSSIIRNKSTEIILSIQIQKEGLKSDSNRQAFERSNYAYDPRKKTYVREFDIWNYQIRDDKARKKKEFSLNPIKEAFEKVKTLTLKNIVDLINSSFKGLEDEIKKHLQETFNGTSGRELVINEEYFQLPKLVLNKNEGTIYLHLPYYVASIAMTNWLNDMLGGILEETVKGFGSWKYFVRQMVGIPNPIDEIKGVTKRGIFQVLDPCAIIRGRIKANEYGWEEVNAFIFSDLIAPHPVGERAIPLLRMFPLRNKLGINWMQFTNLHYFDVKYQQIAGFSITLRNEHSEPVNFKGKVYITLHFKPSDE